MPHPHPPHTCWSPWHSVAHFWHQLWRAHHPGAADTHNTWSSQGGTTPPGHGPPEGYRSRCRESILHHVKRTCCSRGELARGLAPGSISVAHICHTKKFHNVVMWLRACHSPTRSWSLCQWQNWIGTVNNSVLDCGSSLLEDIFHFADCWWILLCVWANSVGSLWWIKNTASLSNITVEVWFSLD